MRGSTGFLSRTMLSGSLLLSLLGSVACQDRWGVPHSGLSMAERPECPIDWGDSIPWFRYEGGDRSAIVTAAGYRPMSGGVPGSEETTDIPEFNDCQRFVRRDEQHYDSLFAIFRGSRQDSITRAFPWDSVQWKSSDTNVATVSSNGMVTGMNPGSTTISAKSTSAPGFSASRVVHVMGADPSPSLSSIDLGVAVDDTMAVQQQRQALSPLGAPTGLTLPVATIYSFGQFYSALGIEPNFNCVYLYFNQQRRLKARVVSVRQLPDQVNGCKVPIVLLDTLGTELPVVRTKVAGFKQAAYPIVARWDWSPPSHTQFFGLGCDDAWCEVGIDNPPDHYNMPGGSTSDDQRVVAIKGWHDEQVLAVPDEGDPDGLLPSSLRATVIPHPDLRKQGWSQAGPPRWYPAAYIAVRDLSGESADDIAYYRDRLNIDLAPIGPLKEMNEMAYCFGKAWECGSVKQILTAAWCDPGSAFGKRWWVRISPAPGSDVLESPRIFCLTRRVHMSGSMATAFNIPSTSRWRWVLRDDTIWSECIQGCCETRGGF